LSWPDQRRPTPRVARAAFAASGRGALRGGTGVLAALVSALVVGLADRGTTAADLPSPPHWEAATPTAWLGGKEAHLAAYLWHDLMPRIVDRGTPLEALRRGLLAAVEVRPMDGSQLPEGVRIEAVWVVQGDEVWPAPIAEQGRWASGEAYGVVARQGPAWELGTSADVFVRARDATGRAALLVIRAQRIGATH
jgi:hypothetical protein